MEFSSDFGFEVNQTYQSELYSDSIGQFKSHLFKTSKKRENKLKNGTVSRGFAKKRPLTITIKNLKCKLSDERSRNRRLKKYSKKLFVQNHQLLSHLRQLQDRRDEIKREYTAYRDYKSKEIRRLRDELDAISKEYYQVMSERDTMNKDMQALEEKIIKIEEINSQIIQSQSHNSSYFNEQIECISKYMSKGLDVSEVNKKDEREDINISFEGVNNDKINLIEDSDDKDAFMSQLFELRKRLEMIIMERDRVTRERESIRGLCGELRSQRDKAISELAESIRQTDEMKKIRMNDLKQIEFLEEKLYECEQRLIPYEQKNNHPEFEEETEENIEAEINGYQSYDDSLNSLSKTDKFKDLKIEFEFDHDNENQLNREIGIEFYFEANKYDPSNETEPDDPCDLGKIFVSKIDQNSVGFGKLKEGDHILYVNETKVEETTVPKFNELINNLNQKKNLFVVRRESLQNGFNKSLSNSNQINHSKASSLQSSNLSNVSYLEYLKKYQRYSQSDSDNEKRFYTEKPKNYAGEKMRTERKINIEKDSIGSSNPISSLGSEKKIADLKIGNKRTNKKYKN